MLEDLAPLLVLAAFVFVLGMVTWWKFARAANNIEWATQFLDAPARRVGGVCVVAALALGLALIFVGVDPNGAFATASVSGMGAFIALLGALGIEGLLLETESVTAARLASGEPPPSSTRGRIVAIALGLAPIIAVVWVFWPR
ncbi:hypothetical protein [Enhygromyxa salina]|uniref:Uncharacterized protein n=1 Tax=Enhygromyxa salina TaxID=215803 RepID=A0A2S9Y665_9BACT|nr:hypothetical protein [Enhygromyxa salina]PRQ00593.1 hypothetical protein ENSA7_60880 [Enhygromyxa salina]